MKHFNKSLSIKSFTFHVKGKAYTVIYMQSIFKELLFIDLWKIKNVLFHIFVIPLSTPRVSFVIFHIFLNYSIYWAAPNNSLISKVFFLFRGTRKTPLSLNIEIDDLSLNLVRKTFSLDFYEMPDLQQLQEQRQQPTLLPWHWTDLVMMHLLDYRPCCWCLW